ncbi:hypothetical protein EIP91_002982 [Steccherinum ochraceum]|uniref:GH18 domain-containing protein n=1 Tax=Steccherinum ochraceum TaxID=92696 RepID=A0A4R0RDP2_9APHY|nr:hypothetical protein EIP91_002982 [Steccherinum ochraceum]
MLYMGPLTTLLALLPLSAWAAPMCKLRSGSAAASSTPPPAATPTVSGSSSTSGNASSDFIATTWYASWHSSTLSAQDISWDKYTSATFAFATTVDDPTAVGYLNETGVADDLRVFVAAAHNATKEAYLTIGGWTGSAYFSVNVGSDANRTAFVKTMVGLVEQYDLDGLDFDWEYPGTTGADCNIYQPDDTANFLSFLQALRQDPGMTGKKITAATSILPFVGPDGAHSTDVSAFADVFDYISIMNYDVWGSFSANQMVGPNAPLNDTCVSDPSQAQGSAVSAVAAWTSAGFPANKIVLGVASYGHSYQVDQSKALSSTTPTNGTLPLNAWVQHEATQPAGDALDAFANASTTSCGTTVPAGYSGVFNFFGLIDKGFLDAIGNPVAGKGYLFDDCSQTPFIYDVDSQVMVSYDNAQSFAAKGDFIKQSGLRGFAMWEAAGDSNDILLDSIMGAISS